MKTSMACDQENPFMVDFVHQLIDGNSTRCQIKTREMKTSMASNEENLLIDDFVDQFMDEYYHKTELPYW